MNDDNLPLAIDPTEVFSPNDDPDRDRVQPFHPWLGVLATAIAVAHSGILSVDDVAAVLRCSADTVRRISFNELASYQGPGRGVLYRMEDVQKYLHRRKRHQKRRSGMGHPTQFRPDPKAGTRNLAEDALKAIGQGGRA